MEEEKATVAEVEAERKIYEVGFYIAPSVPEEKIGAEVSALKDVLEKSRAIVISEELPKSRLLSYGIFKIIDGRRQRFDRAYFGWIKFETPAGAVAAVKDFLDKNPAIVRFLIIKTVRENTMSGPKIPSFRRVVPGKTLKVETKVGEAKVPISEAELDKTIKAMVGE